MCVCVVFDFLTRCPRGQQPFFLQSTLTRPQLNTSFEDLHHKYGIPKSTLCDRARGMQTRQKAHEEYQALTPAMEDALKKWELRMDSQGFPLRLDIFKAVAKKQLDDSNDSEPKTVGPT